MQTPSFIIGKYDPYNVIKSRIERHYPGFSFNEDKYVFSVFQDGFYIESERGLVY